MKAINIKTLDGKIEVDNNLPIPTLSKNEILIKIEGTQINPADLNGITRAYKDYINKFKSPYEPGIEGVGIVVDIGDKQSESQKKLLNKKVAYVTVYGSWAEYVKVDPRFIIIIDDTMTKDNEWVSYCNPMTVMCMLDIAKKAKAKYIVQTGANSSCGKMFIKACKLNNIGTINIVRKDEYIEPLKKIGADVVT
jgi:NADPH:quinone reductase-like Zn-dependent oxidoreductase